jgi:drug/metabolite transporter (DMT)-like permease
MRDRTDDRSLGDLLAELSRETSALVRKEVELATTEISAKMKKAGIQAGIMAAGGALVHAGLLVLLAGIVLGLAELGVASWLSALIVAVAVIGGGYFLINQAMTKMRATNYVPTQTMESLKETASWTTRTRA